MHYVCTMEKTDLVSLSNHVLSCYPEPLKKKKKKAWFFLASEQATTHMNVFQGFRLTNRLYSKNTPHPTGQQTPQPTAQKLRITYTIITLH